MMMTKVCKKCGAEKVLDQYYKQARMSCGCGNICKTCLSIYGKERRQNVEIKESLKEYHRRKYLKNKIQHNERCKLWSKNNPGKKRESSARYRENHPEKVKITHRVSDIKARQNLNDSYIKQIFWRTGIKHIPKDLIELKKIHLTLKRSKNERQNEQSINP